MTEHGHSHSNVPKSFGAAFAVGAALLALVDVDAGRRMVAEQEPLAESQGRI
jgi:hypothetical protein